MRALMLYQTYAGKTVAILCGAAALSIFLYGALLLGAVAHAAGRTAAEREARALGAEVSRLEARYLAATRALSPERAAAMGFVAPESVTTVFAAPAAALVVR